MRSFERQHRSILKVCVSAYNEAKLYAAVSAETLTAHIAKIEVLVQHFQIDAKRFWNLDETGTTPVKDTRGNFRQKHYIRRGGACEHRVPDFDHASRVTVLPVVSASGETGPPLFVFKGKCIPYRQVLVGGALRAETYTQYLPRSACVAVREECGGVDSANFLNWAKELVKNMPDLTCGGRHVLLTYDAYRAHMSLAVLLILHTHRIVVYTLPAHTGAKTQPIDVVLFSIFKRELNRAVARTM